MAITWQGDHQERPSAPLYRLYVDFMARDKCNYLIIMQLCHHVYDKIYNNKAVLLSHSYLWLDKMYVLYFHGYRNLIVV